MKIFTNSRKSKLFRSYLHQYTVTLINEENSQVVEYLKKFDIPSMIYNPLPIHLQKAFSSLGYKIGDLAITESLSKRVLSIPIHTELTSLQ